MIIQLCGSSGRYVDFSEFSQSRLGQDVSQVLSKASFIKKLRNQLCYRIIESDVLQAESLQVRAGFNLVSTNIGIEVKNAHAV